MKPFGFIYISTNSINNKKYIGQCSYSKPGWNSYLGSGIFLKKAIKKYGRESFSREIICDAFSREDLSFLEIYFIKEYDAVNDNKFYNIAEGGYVTRGFSGKVHSEEYKQKMKEFSKNRPATVNMKSNMSNIGKEFGGFKNTESHRLAIQKVGLSNKGKIASEKTKIKMSLAHSGKNNSRSKTWHLESEDGKILIIESLNPWCREQKIGVHALANTFNTKKFHKGFRVISSQ